MEQKNHILFKIIKIIVVIFAIGNFAAIFLYEYKLSDLSVPAKSVIAETSEVSVTEEETSSAYTLQMDSDTLTYDGSGQLNLLDGVSLVDADGNTSDSNIFAHIKTGDSFSKKIVEYTADTEDGQVTASRNLVLENYKGPSIQLPDSLPQIEDGQLDDILSYMPSDGSFYADDGYDNDITSAVTASYTTDETDSSIIHYVFSVTNSYNDTTSAAADLTLSPTKPVLTLKETEATIDLHSSFSPLRYVASAKDVDGTSLDSRIQIEGEVNTDEVGEYVLIYFVTSPSGEVSAKKELTVTVR